MSIFDIEENIDRPLREAKFSEFLENLKNSDEDFDYEIEFEGKKFTFDACPNSCYELENGGTLWQVHVDCDGKLYTEDSAMVPVFKESTALDIFPYLASAVVDVDNYDFIWRRWKNPRSKGKKYREWWISFFELTDEEVAKLDKNKTLW